MPGMSGPELRNRLLLLGRLIPTLFITAHVEEVPADPVPHGEIPEVLLKPFDDKSLLAGIGRCIRPLPGSV